MNQAHLHLLFNHLPIIGTLIGLLTLLAGFLLGNNIVKRTAMGIFIFAAICAIPAILTGEGAEEAIEQLPGLNGGFIKAHEEMAEIFIWLSSVLGMSAAATLFLDIKENALSKILYFVTLAIALATMFVGQQVGTTGGEIRHTEIRTGATQINQDFEGSQHRKKEEDND